MNEVGSAVVVVTSPDALRTVGGLPLALRALLALRAARVPRIAVWAGAQEPALRAAAERRRLTVDWIPASGSHPGVRGVGACLVVPGEALVDAAGVARAPRCPASALPGLLTTLGTGTSLRDALEGAGLRAGPGPGDGLFVPLDAARPPGALETRLLDHLAHRTTAKDSYLAARIDRRLSRPLTRLLLPWPVSPSQVTLASILVGLAGAAGLMTVSYWGRVLGLLALVASIVLDCVDGEIARARVEQSPAGARLDVIGDYVVHLATFVGLGVGLARQGLPPAGYWAILLLLGGVAAAMATIHALFVRPALTGGGDLHWAGHADGLPRGNGEGLAGTPLGTVVGKLASRDYTYLLLLFALVGHLEWFLYAAAAGSWGFVGTLLGYFCYHRLGSRRPAVQ